MLLIATLTLALRLPSFPLGQQPQQLEQALLARAATDDARATLQAFEELERTFASLDFEEIFQKMEITNAGLELPKMKLDFSANLKPALQDIGELEQRMVF